METANLVIQTISNVGFPIAMTLLMFYYIKTNHDDNKKTYADLNEKHQCEIEALTKTVDRAVDVIEINNEYLRKGIKI